MAAIIPVTINMQYETNGPVHTLTVVGEPLAPGLAITPALDHGDALHGGWTITHLPSGRMVFPISACLGCLRYAARKLTEAGIDWTRDMESLTSDEMVGRAAHDFAWDADGCDGSECGIADAIPEAA